MRTVENTGTRSRNALTRTACTCLQLHTCETYIQIAQVWAHPQGHKDTSSGPFPRYKLHTGVHVNITVTT